MTTLPALGSVNAYRAASATRLATGERFTHTGTTLCLTRAALKLGVEDGELIRDDLGLLYELCPDGGGERTDGGRWLRRLYGGAR